MKRPIGIGIALALVAAMASLAAVSAQDEDLVIWACVNPAGATRIVDAGTTCHGQEILYRWNSAGVPGPQGPQGEPGPQGDPGPAGTASLTVEYAHDVGFAGIARAMCPPGTLLTGGGGFTAGTGALVQSFPIEDAGGGNAWGAHGTGWQVVSSNWDDQVQAFAVCLTVP